jgi:hypothetical protein
MNRIPETRGFMLFWIVATILWTAAVISYRSDELNDMRHFPSLSKHGNARLVDTQLKKCTRATNENPEAIASCLAESLEPGAKEEMRKEERLRERVFWEVVIPPALIALAYALFFHRRGKI